MLGRQAVLRQGFQQVVGQMAPTDPAHAALGGYKESGIGRETHKMMLDHDQQTKNLLVSYSESKLGFF
ncbi:MAG: hypothetical protein JO142_01205 [Burkholderiales bacterium]|nr:hypothetical protein [Burkholderiales bacterium]